LIRCKENKTERRQKEKLSHPFPRVLNVPNFILVYLKIMYHSQFGTCSQFLIYTRYRYGTGVNRYQSIRPLLQDSREAFC
jgi:hypothetical protein